MLDPIAPMTGTFTAAELDQLRRSIAASAAVRAAAPGRVGGGDRLQ